MGKRCKTKHADRAQAERPDGTGRLARTGRPGWRGAQRSAGQTAFLLATFVLPVSHIRAGYCCRLAGATSVRTIGSAGRAAGPGRCGGSSPENPARLGGILRKTLKHQVSLVEKENIEVPITFSRGHKERKGLLIPSRDGAERIAPATEPIHHLDHEETRLAAANGNNPLRTCCLQCAKDR